MRRFGGRDLVRLLTQAVVGAVDGVKPQPDLELLFLLGKHQKFLRLFALRFQRAYAPLKLGQNVAQAQQIFLRGGKAFVRVVAAVAEMRDPRRLLKHFAAFARFGGHHIGNAPLPDDGIPVAAKPRIHKQLVDVAKSGGFAVDDVFAFARAVVTAGDRNLVRILLERAVAVVEAQRHLGKALGAAQIRPHKDDVLHL